MDGFKLIGGRWYPTEPPRLPDGLFGAWLKSGLSVSEFLRTLN